MKGRGLPGRFLGMLPCLLLCGELQAAELSKSTEVIDLKGLWLFHEGDNPSFARPMLDDYRWKERELPSASAPTSERWVGYGWYRHHIFIDEAVLDNMMVSLGHAREAVEVYVNGSLVAARGRFGTPSYGGARELPLTGIVPKGILKAGDNTIAVRIYDPSYTSGHSQWSTPFWQSSGGCGARRCHRYADHCGARGIWSARTLCRHRGLGVASGLRCCQGSNLACRGWNLFGRYQSFRHRRLRLHSRRGAQRSSLVDRSDSHDSLFGKLLRCPFRRTGLSTHPYRQRLSAVHRRTLLAPPGWHSGFHGTTHSFADKRRGHSLFRQSLRPSGTQSRFWSDGKFIALSGFAVVLVYDGFTSTTSALPRSRSWARSRFWSLLESPVPEEAHGKRRFCSPSNTMPQRTLLKL